MSAQVKNQFRVTQAQIDAFQLDGAIVLRQLLRPEEVSLLKAGIDTNLAHPSPRAKVASRSDDPGRLSKTSAAGRRMSVTGV